MSSAQTIELTMKAVLKTCNLGLLISLLTMMKTTKNPGSITTTLTKTFYSVLLVQAYQRQSGKVIKFSTALKLCLPRSQKFLNSTTFLRLRGLKMSYKSQLRKLIAHKEVAIVSAQEVANSRLELLTSNSSIKISRSEMLPSNLKILTHKLL